jgi:hypothetical protein
MIFQVIYSSENEVDKYSFSYRVML